MMKKQHLNKLWNTPHMQKHGKEAYTYAWDSVEDLRRSIQSSILHLYKYIFCR